jgi:hypothetical protein
VKQKRERERERERDRERERERERDLLREEKVVIKNPGQVSDTTN